MQNILIKKNQAAIDDFSSFLREERVIPALKSMQEIDKILDTRKRLYFVLFGDILTLPDFVSKLKNAGKTVMVHIDLIDGLHSQEIAVDFIAKKTLADGILSTKANLIKYAKTQRLLTIQRFFVLDSMALVNIKKQFPLEYADAVEIMPGLMPKIIRQITGLTNKPIIAGGLITDSQDVESVLSAGAAAVSTSKLELFQ